MIIRGGTYPIPFCRACKPHVLKFTDHSSSLGVGGFRSDLCDGRPAILRGACKGSTETIKYLGKFDTLDECEAACLEYSMGSTRCRSFTYHFAAYKDKRFRHTCFGVTNPKWLKVCGCTELMLLGILLCTHGSFASPPLCGVHFRCRCQMWREPFTQKGSRQGLAPF